MPTITSLPVDASNSPHSTQAAKALANDENYCQIDTMTGYSGASGEIAIFSDWDDVASGLPSDSTIDGVQIEFPEYYGTVSCVDILISINGGSSYSSAQAVDLSGMQKSTDDDVITPSGETELWGLTWDPASLDWDDVFVKVTVDCTGAAADKLFYFDYIQMKVHYTEAAVSVPTYTSDDNVIIKNGRIELKNGMIEIKGP